MVIPDEIVEVPGQPHTFGLASARNMLMKLEWEVRELARPDTYTLYRAFNAAVTAWHMADWVWHDLREEQRARWSDETHLRDWFVDRCPELGLCGMIANASKHRKRRKPPTRTGVATLAFADVVHAKCGIAKCGDPLATWTWRLIIREGEREHSAVDVFARVLDYWREFIAREIPAA